MADIVNFCTTPLLEAIWRIPVACCSALTVWCHAHAGSGFISSGQQSDHLLMVAAYNAWEDAKVQVRIAPCLECHAQLILHNSIALPRQTCILMTPGEVLSYKLQTCREAGRQQVPSRVSIC